MSVMVSFTHHSSCLAPLLVHSVRVSNSICYFLPLFTNSGIIKHERGWILSVSVVFVLFVLLFLPTKSVKINHLDKLQHHYVQQTQCAVCFVCQGRIFAHSLWNSVTVSIKGIVDSKHCFCKHALNILTCLLHPGDWLQQLLSDPITHGRWFLSVNRYKHICNIHVNWSVIKSALFSQFKKFLHTNSSVLLGGRTARVVWTACLVVKTAGYYN